jgi:hypothetical protein
MKNLTSNGTNPPLLTDVYPQRPIAECADTVGRILESGNAEARRLVAELFSRQPIVTYTYRAGHTFWRGRPCADGQPFKTVEQMLWPPTTQSIGRANEVGEVVLYASSHLPTALAEISPPPGSRVQTVAIQIRTDRQLHLCFIGDILRVSRTGQSGSAGPSIASAIQGLLSSSDPGAAGGLVYTDAFAAEAFSDRDNHRIAAMISSHFFQRLPMLDGVVYPSVRTPGGQNVALRTTSFSDNCRVAGASIVEFRRDYRFGFFDAPLVTVASELDPAGRFVWAERVTSPAAWLQWPETPSAPI